MNKSIIIGFAALAILVQGCGPDLDSYQTLLTPRITTIPDQTMLSVTVTGDPAITGKTAFSALFKTYFKLNKADRVGEAIPRARWPKSFDSPRDEWVGIYGMPVAESVTAVPEHESAVPLLVEKWAYGEVAEILHHGSYATETGTIERLYQFITDQGYRISGPHEEVYLKGPGMFGPGNPEKYQTIIRYQVEKL